MAWQIPNVSERLAQLPAAKCVLFGGCCVAHALSVMPVSVHERAAQKQRDSRLGLAQLRGSLDRLLAWVRGAALEPKAEYQWIWENCLPDPAHLYKGEIDLFFVTHTCWECAAWDDDSAHRARLAGQVTLESYTALYHWYIVGNPAYRLMGRIAAQQIEPMCIAELRFQNEALEYIEQMTIAAEMTYESLFAAIAQQQRNSG